MKTDSGFPALKRKEKTKKPEDSPILQSIFDGIPDGILVMDRDYNVVMFNKAMQKFMGITAEEIEGRYCYSLCFDSKHVCADCYAPSVFANAKAPSRIRTCFRENLEREFEIWNFPIRNKNGEVHFIIEYMKDITDKLAMEKDLMQAQRLAIIGEIAAKTAHEIRNPLNAIEGAAHFLLDEYKEDPKLQKYLGLIKDQIARLDKVTTDLLGASKPRIARGEKTLINSVILKSIDVAEYIARDKKISMELYIDERIPKISFDEEKIQQVLINILKNACDAVHEKGTIEVVGHLRQRKGEKFVEISILDNGVGMPGKDSEKVFDSFYTTKKNGTGLGLAIVKDIMKSHGGYVLFEGQPSGGTCVSVGLPVK